MLISSFTFRRHIDLPQEVAHTLKCILFKLFLRMRLVDAQEGLPEGSPDLRTRPLPERRPLRPQKALDFRPGHIRPGRAVEDPFERSELLAVHEGNGIIFGGIVKG